MHLIYGILGLFVSVMWGAVTLLLIRHVRQVTHLKDVPVEETDSLPRLSILVPALNEGGTVEQAMRTLLALDYPDLEIIAVNDRSTDMTGAILDRIATEVNTPTHTRLRVVHVTELPPGWLGKNHALHLGSQQATGEYILFTDADVHFEPSALLRAVRYMRSRTLDHLVIFPQVILVGFWETLYVTFFGTMFAIYTRLWEVANPKSKAHIGVGAFNLVRADTYRKMGGHAVLPFDVADDVKLGKKMKESGGRQEIIPADDMVRVRWVVGLRGAIEGLTKNMFAGVAYRPERVLSSALALLLLVVYPYIGIGFGPLWTRLLCGIAVLCMPLLVWCLPPAPRVSPLYGLFYPVAGLLFLYTLLRSMIYTYRQGGVVWRGTLYPLSELRKGVV